MRESEYFANQGRTLNAIIRRLGFFLAVLMGIGAVFGALNTMYSAVAARTREIATLRALGFGSGPVVVSVLAEALLLALVRRRRSARSAPTFGSTATARRR